MNSQEKLKSNELSAEAQTAGTIPQSEQAQYVGDDEDAKIEVGEDSLPRGLAQRPWRVAKALLALRTQVNTLAPRRSKTSDGTIGDAAHRTRASDHNPWVNDGAEDVVTAMDITHDPTNGCDAGLLAEVICNSRDARVKYVIWNRRIANSAAINGQPPWTWRPYTGQNPHNHHVHLSVLSEKPKYDSTADWAIAVAA